MIFMSIVSLFSFFSAGETQPASTFKPFVPNRVRVLVVSPGDVYYSGAYYLVSDLARYGFNITHQTSVDANATDYLNDPKTSDLNQYDVVILHGILGFPASKVSAVEVAHFTNYPGILILTGNALFANETSGALWGFDSEPVRRIEQRLGVDFTGYLGAGGAWHNSGEFELVNDLITGLHPSMTYLTEHPGSINYQLELDTPINGAALIYTFTITSSPVPSLVGSWTCGVTYYKNASGAVGIYVQGACIYGVASGPFPSKIGYFGLTNSSERSSLFAHLIAHALEEDIDTVIKPQPLANIRLEGVGEYFTQAYLNASLSNFNSVLDAYNVTPTIGFIDFLDFKPDYWQNVAPQVLSQLKGTYRDWEYSTSLRYYTDPRLMTQSQVTALIDSIIGNYSKLEMDLFSTVIAPSKGASSALWDQSTLDAMSGRDLYLLDVLDTRYPDWWNLRVNSTVVVHGAVPLLPERIAYDSTVASAENFTQPGLSKDALDYKYFSRRDKWALAALNGFPSFVFYVPNFRWNEVGAYSLRMAYENLTSEIPDIRFVPLLEAGLYFGNKWMRIENAVRTDSVIEFDIDASSIPEVVNIGKGMLWLRINANESIQEVSIDNNPWFYFDERSIRIPAPESSAHVRVKLGALSSPRVVESRYKVTIADFDGYHFNVSIVSAQKLNASVSLFLPKNGSFSKDNWNVFTLETQWNFEFSFQHRLLKLWAVSDGFASFKVGVFWIVEQTPPRYDSSVTVSANFSGLELEILEVIFSYDLGLGWTNATTVLQGELHVATIPAMAFDTAVKYKFFAYSAIGKWFVTEEFSYNVIDDIPPEVDAPEWHPYNPVAGESVHVQIGVGEPENASGVENAVLYYYLGTNPLDVLKAQKIEMTHEDGVWLAAIPGQSGGSVVTFSVEAYDKAGNHVQTSYFNYSVWILPISPLLFALIVGAVVAICVGVILYIRRLRKIRRHVEVPKDTKQV